MLLQELYVSIAGEYSRHSNKAATKSNRDASMQVSKLFFYPIKSLRGLSPPRLELGPLGPAWDRRFLIADDAGRFLTQRQHPELCLVDLEWNGQVLRLDAPRRLALVLDIDAAREQRVAVTVWRDSVMACDMGEAAATWLSDYLQRPARLYFMPGDSVREVDQTFAQPGDRVAFADGFPILLTTEASLAAINRELPAPIGMERFRPNIVVTGSGEFAEDDWRRLRIGALEFDIVKPCSRCVIPSIDPRTAEKQPIVTQTLWRLRRRGNTIYFGQNVIHRGQGTIAVGDEVVVLA